MVTPFFGLLRKESPPPPRPSLKVSPSELTAGAPELDTLLTVHLHVCKVLLQVSGQGGARPGWGLGSEAVESLGQVRGPPPPTQSHRVSIAGGEEPHGSQRAKPWTEWMVLRYMCRHRTSPKYPRWASGHAARSSSNAVRRWPSFNCFVMSSWTWWADPGGSAW